jgi:predicted pyridoxine 5'-phosphate oxidase superfamily flavin-nucleotide-binding protein
VGVTGFYHEGSRRLQDAFDTRRLADRLEDVTVHDVIDADDRAFIESMDMFFIATADEHGRPECSYKGGEPGFVRVLDERTIAFPGYDGNGMFKSFGNLLVNPEVGLLFISFERRKRLRLNGTAGVDPDDPLLGSWPGATLVVRGRAREVFPNSPRYIHRMELVERSR